MNAMKYAKDFLEETMHIRPLAEVMVDEDCDVLIGGKQTGIHINWREYVKWLETKYDNRRHSGVRNEF